MGGVAEVWGNFLGGYINYFLKKRQVKTVKFFKLWLL